MEKTHMADRLTNGMVGEIAYVLKVDGVVIDEVPAESPIEYLHGYENIIPGLETALEGKGAGDKFSLTIQPEDGYGEYDEEDIDEVDLSDFEEFDQLEVGMEIELFDEDGDFYEATIKEIKDDAVVLDFNSPLAGKTLEYDVEVISVRAATEAETEMGLPSSLADDMFGDADVDLLHAHDHDHDHD
jgi:FKBP-type peptidyl-prolyl cis-trans isomerase SlyD